jgi:hypothetical protein
MPPSQWLNNALNNLNLSELTSVIVRPTEAQIDLATEEIRFGIITNPVNSVCPISQERFSPNELVLQVVYCGHNFRNNLLRQWFESNVRCPLCRYDIREYDPRNAIHNPFQRTVGSNRSNAQSPLSDDAAEHLAANVLNSLGDATPTTINNNTVTNPSFLSQNRRVMNRTIPYNVSDSRASIVSRLAYNISNDIVDRMGEQAFDISSNITLGYNFNRIHNPNDNQSSLGEDISNNSTG